VGEKGGNAIEKVANAIKDKGSEMKRIILTAGAALLVTLPAAIGFTGNTSFAQSIPVRVPSQAVVVDDHGGQSKHAEAGDDKGGLRGGDDSPKHS
jgi:hypothetical protein